jgi:putative transferase (TIGR04331 family)
MTTLPKTNPNKTLFLAQIPENFSPKKHTALSVNCFVGKEDIYPDWENLEFVDPATDHNFKKDSDQMTDILINNFILPELATQLNEHNNVSYSLKFWTILLKHWLLDCTYLCWINYYRLKTFIDNNNQIDFEVPIFESEDKWNFIDKEDFFQRGCFNSDFHHFILSKFIKKIKPDNWNLIKEPHEITQNNAKESVCDYRSRRCVGIHGLNSFEEIIISIILSLKKSTAKISLAQNSNFETKVETTKTKDNKLITEFFGNDFLITFKEIVQENLPIMYTKYFHEKLKRAKKQHYKEGKLRIIGGLLYNCAQIKFYLALAKEKGEKIICCQHGGNYGNMEPYTYSPKIEYIHDAFLSWGWKEHGQYKGNFIPIPSPMLSKFIGKYKARNNNILFIGTVMRPVDPSDLNSCPSGKTLIKYRKDKNIFLNNIAPQVFPQIIYCPYPKRPGVIEDSEYIKKHFPKIKINNQELTKSMLDCKLIVLDHPGTTFNLAMAANIPTIAFWNEEWKMCSQAHPYFDLLYQAGIIFKTPQEAAKKIDSINQDIQTWWNKKEIQEARKKWTNQYALADEKWFSKWIKTIRNL